MCVHTDDNDDPCWTWAVHGQCVTNSTYMYAVCPQSCAERMVLGGRKCTFPLHPTTIHNVLVAHKYTQHPIHRRHDPQTCAVAGNVRRLHERTIMHGCKHIHSITADECTCEQLAAGDCDWGEAWNICAWILATQSTYEMGMNASTTNASNGLFHKPYCTHTSCFNYFPKYKLNIAFNLWNAPCITYHPPQQHATITTTIGHSSPGVQHWTACPRAMVNCLQLVNTVHTIERRLLPGRNVRVERIDVTIRCADSVSGGDIIIVSWIPANTNPT